MWCYYGSSLWWCKNRVLPCLCSVQLILEFLIIHFLFGVTGVKALTIRKNKNHAHSSPLLLREQKKPLITRIAQRFVYQRLYLLQLNILNFELSSDIFRFHSFNLSLVRCQYDRTRNNVCQQQQQQWRRRQKQKKSEQKRAKKMRMSASMSILHVRNFAVEWKMLWCVQITLQFFFCHVILFRFTLISNIIFLNRQMIRIAVRAIKHEHCCHIYCVLLDE